MDGGRDVTYRITGIPVSYLFLFLFATPAFGCWSTLWEMIIILPYCDDTGMVRFWLVGFWVFLVSAWGCFGAGVEI